jgi:hypothetical protein
LTWHSRSLHLHALCCVHVNHPCCPQMLLSRATVGCRMLATGMAATAPAPMVNVEMNAAGDLPSRPVTSKDQHQRMAAASGWTTGVQSVVPLFLHTSPHNLSIKRIALWHAMPPRWLEHHVYPLLCCSQMSRGGARCMMLLRRSLLRDCGPARILPF